MRFSRFLFCLAVPSTIFAKTVTYDWNITWTSANPDGQFDRRTIGINGKWPIPAIEVDKGDRIIINMHNGLGDEDTSLHFHGLFQNGTTHMDGPIQTTQCPVGPGQSMVYDFKVDQPGTYWYHSHNKGQYPDGLRGPFIVHDKDDPHKDLYDEEIVLTLSDWYHENMPKLISEFLSYTNPSGAEPVPQAALMNDSQNITIAVQPGKTYLVRIINIAAFAAQYLWFEDHDFKVVEVDGVYTEPLDAKLLYISAAQRVSILLTTKNDTTRNYAFVGSMDEDLFDEVPEGLNQNVTGWLMYNNDAPKPEPLPIDDFNPIDDFLLVPTDGGRLLPDPDYSITLNVTMDNLSDGANYAFFNGITFVRPKVPTLYTALTTREFATNPVVYGVNTHGYVLNHMDIIEIVVNNNDPGKHPFHLHGHHFQVTHRSSDDAGNYDPRSASTPPVIPMRRDVILAPPNGNVVLRFRADNAGIWLFHCHLEWHLVSGLAATFIEAPLQLQKTITIPEDHLAACKRLGIPTSGNAAGNTKNFLDLTGANTSPPPLPPGFTARGIVALVFTAMSAILGMAVIVLYGMAEPIAPRAVVHDE
ncbi:putative ferrooxidoreductase Fet3 [Terfezia boudieri ATCC MYA-4762]|uniref:Putative ferrooxidoreductase Fet3 n=1 Tax=Terfezia boudieri ATCC MYA-4762 TaxID=1051890 RepID=A0A3N4LWW8_9PEZI|nr:putative ferrooxidoreductase Fet3 [Terfezia boudieri ATCC MYA-4762]